MYTGLNECTKLMKNAMHIWGTVLLWQNIVRSWMHYWLTAHSYLIDLWRLSWFALRWRGKFSHIPAKYVLYRNCPVDDFFKNFKLTLWFQLFVWHVGNWVCALCQRDSAGMSKCTIIFICICMFSQLNHLYLYPDSEWEELLYTVCWSEDVGL